jgi:predicted dehydrogenase
MDRPELFHSLAQADYVTILGVTPSGQIPLVRQFRPALERVNLELPGGLLDGAEDPGATARRELLEETGFTLLRAPQLLGRLAPDSGRLENAMWCFHGEPADEPEPGWSPEAGVERASITIPCSRRCRLKERRRIDPSSEDAVMRVMETTHGRGADGVIVTAASASDELISSAFRMCRRKGRVVLVGNVGLKLKRSDLYEKELDFLVSTSYGPGRYDDAYERDGHDYPLAYVRWTENRNMEEYLARLADGSVRIAPFTGHRVPVAEASRAFALLQGPEPPLTVLLEYPGDAAPTRTQALGDVRVARHRAGAVGLAVVGAGSFARQAHLPELKRLGESYAVRAVASRTGHNAEAAARQSGAAYATTDFHRVLADPEVDAVLIATRHDLHASLALAALRAGKHVLVEKPLALTAAELDEIERFYAAEGEREKPLLMTGFNRRFSPYGERLRALVESRAGPLMIDYRVNAGFVAPDHWVHGPEGGGRNLGEACHFYDLFTFLTESRVASVRAAAIRPVAGNRQRNDNFSALLSFDDGSIATLTYSALGNPDFAKERMELYCDGMVVELDDYRRLRVHGARGRDLETRLPQKGLREELIAFHRAIALGEPWPIPLWHQIQATRIALGVEASLAAR